MLYPEHFSAAHPPRDASIAKLCEFFDAKGLAALKEEDRREQWYEDWLAYQAEHRLYASVLSPKAYSSLGNELDLLRLTRFLEVFGYFSPAHGYSLQVTFLGLFSILMGDNDALKREAVAAIEAGGLLAFGVSEKEHGSDLLGIEFHLREISPGQWIANGTKYYIGNTNAAAIISILARVENERSAGRMRRAPMMLFALRPAQSPGLRNVRKIRTFGVRAAFVGKFEVKDHPVAAADVIAEGRGAWDAVFGTVTLGKFFLGFGAIGICERAYHEAAEHVRRRQLYGRSVLEMEHIRSLMAQAYARLTAMKMFAYRALDYVRAAGPDERRYLLFTAVQKAKVSTEGEKVIALLAECIGAKGFEADTYFEMARRDVPLIPSLEGSVHLNLALAAQFIPRYFGRADVELPSPGSLVAASAAAGENPYLMEARCGGLNAIEFAHCLRGYKPLCAVANVRLFARQTKAFELFIRKNPPDAAASDTPLGMARGQIIVLAAYAQLIAENARLLDMPPPVISTIFHLLVVDMSGCALTLAALIQPHQAGAQLARRLAIIPQTDGRDWEFLAQRVAGGD